MNKYRDLLKFVDDNFLNYDSDEVSRKLKKITLEEIKDHYENNGFLLQKRNEYEKKKNTTIIKDMNFIDWINDILSKSEVLITKEFIKELNNNKYIIFEDMKKNNKNLLKDPNMLDSSINGVLKLPYYKTSLEKYSVIWFRLIKNHPFVDGNKRTATIGVKISLILSLIDGLNNFVCDKILPKVIDPILDEGQKKMMKIFRGKQKTLNDKKISKSKIEKAFKKQKNQIIKRLKENVNREDEVLIQNILKNWNNFFIEDLVLATYVAQFSLVDYQDNKNLEKIYEILSLNLEQFIYLMIDEYLSKILIFNFSQYVNMFLNHEEIRKIFNYKYILDEVLKS